MVDFSYHLKLVDEAIAAYEAGIGDTRLIDDLVEQCRRIAADPDAPPNASLDKRYHKAFYLEFLSIGLHLREDFSSTYKSAGRLLNNVGFNESGGNRGRENELPVLLAWYFWKSADCNRTKRFDSYKIDWKSAENAETVWFPKLINRLKELRSVTGKPIAYHTFEWIEPHGILASKDDTAIEAYKKEIRNGPRKPNNKPDIKRDWIDPYNLSAIPFVGRENELKQLDDFAGNCEQADFKIWVMVAPSGAGKTRLTYEWIKRKDIADHWQVLYLGLDASEGGADQNQKLTCLDGSRNKVPLDQVSLERVSQNNKDGSDWSGWSPERPHIFIIDYVFGFAQVINGLVERARENAFNHPVRLLVLDHKFPESFDQFQGDPRWSWASSDGERMSVVKSFFYNEGKPLDLSSSQEGGIADLTEALLRAVVESTVKRAVEDHEDESRLRLEVDENTLDQAIEYLKNQPNAQYPLFAALVGDAIRRKKDFSRWNRRDLAEFYLSGKQRLPWENNLLDEEHSYWGASLVAAATALRGLEVSQIRRWKPEGGISKPKDWQPVLDIGKRLISKAIDAEIPPFEPDYVGEGFFLTYLQRLLQRDLEFEAFCYLLSSGSFEQQAKGALAFLAFVQRLTGNLLNEDQSLPITKRHWQDLLAFLTPDNFEENTMFRWAVSAALINLAHQNKPSHGIKSTNGTAIEWPDNEGLYYRFNMGWTALMIACGFDQGQAALAMIEKMEVVDQTNDAGVTALMIACRHDQEQAALAMIEKMERFDQVDANGWTALIAACRFNLERAALAMIKKLERFDQTDALGWTALMFACRYDQEPAALAMIEKMERFDQTDSDTGVTALMIACRYNRTQAALAMIVKMEVLDQADVNGWTALMFACRYDQEQVALAMIEKMEVVDQIDDDGVTALMTACGHGQEQAALAMIEKMERFDQTDVNDWTALMIACRYDQGQAALAMIEKMEVVDQTNDAGVTALMIACRHDQEQAALAMIEKMERFDQINDEGVTALMTACRYAQEQAALAMIAKMERFDQTSKNGWTTLMYACFRGLTDIVAALISAGAEINAQTRGGQTALQAATIEGNIDCVKFLLAQADIDIETRWSIAGQNYAALDLAEQEGHTEIADLIRAAKAERSGRT